MTCKLGPRALGNFDDKTALFERKNVIPSSNVAIVFYTYQDNKNCAICTLK